MARAPLASKKAVFYGINVWDRHARRVKHVHIRSEWDVRSDTDQLNFIGLKDLGYILSGDFNFVIKRGP